MRIALLALLVTLTLAAPDAQMTTPCLHDRGSEPAAQRVRRDKALRLAQMIDAAEAAVPGVGSYGRQIYRPLDQLPIIPATPAGFHLQFHTDGDSYAFSIKDMIDTCHYAVFSDQDRRIYEATPRNGTY